MPQQLASFPGPKTGRGYSAVVLDRSQVPPSSPCTRTLGGAWERGYISLVRLPEQQHALLSFLSWAYLACVLVALLFRQRGGCHTAFDSTFLSFQAPPLLAKSFAGHTIVPYRRTPKLHFENFPYQLPLRFTLGCEKYHGYYRLVISMEIHNFVVHFQIFHDATIVIQRIRNLRYDVRIHMYIHTYIHTDTACVQHVNVGLAQARPNK